MNLLWKKEKSGLHFDLFPKRSSEDALVHKFKTMAAVSGCQKNNAISKRLREMGNGLLAEKNWYAGMMYYNRSLRYAELGTENVSLAYANRSVCFLKMEMYDKCLNDIELAIKANYPKRLMEKLEERRVFCLQQLSKAKPIELSAPKLDFDADENIPGMANVLQMQCNEQFGRHFIAKCDIDVGKVVMLEEAFVTSIVTKPGLSICEACYKAKTNFIACPKCTTALFCDQTCAEDPLHQIRCERSSPSDDPHVEFTARTVVHAMNMFSSIDDLMDFVQFVVEEKRKGVPSSIIEPKDKYRMFLKMNLSVNPTKYVSPIDRGKQVFEILLLKFNDLFNTKKKERFLMHLCVMHAYIVLCNTFQNPTTGAVLLLHNHINHSCVPNVIYKVAENKGIGTTLRRIKKGQQLFIQYGMDGRSRHVRQKMLNEHFDFKCKCERCKNHNFPVSCDRVKADPQVQQLAKEVQAFLANDFDDDIPKCAILKQMCLEILKKYADFPWCTELDGMRF